MKFRQIYTQREELSLNPDFCQPFIEEGEWPSCLPVEWKREEPCGETEIVFKETFEGGKGIEKWILCPCKKHVLGFFSVRSRKTLYRREIGVHEFPYTIIDFRNTVLEIKKEIETYNLREIKKLTRRTLKERIRQVIKRIINIFLR